MEPGKSHVDDRRLFHRKGAAAEEASKEDITGRIMQRRERYDEAGWENRVGAVTEVGGVARLQERVGREDDVKDRVHRLNPSFTCSLVFAWGCDIEGEDGDVGCDVDKNEGRKGEV